MGNQVPDFLIYQYYMKIKTTPSLTILQKQIMRSLICCLEQRNLFGLSDLGKTTTRKKNHAPHIDYEHFPT